ncbi:MULTISPECIES: helix-hairpin-helix domain-containing protein [Haloferax]|uniref:Helix-hairpin-helix domain-containing protein n=1 Tax=Haloferax marinum TaxID=2666143 RepID=A0A6A8G9X7_9EURY|nr:MULTISPECIES: helix-hairpin-helix domain-containing protein [Haloferax]KAB1198296.1 helix-hairpin-helix domain-containing protein [Haloferax sp. CBA1150]MRW97392.1 helix-hairpin-helix domain-containing protein [Haloferax marinum]
MRVFLTDGTSFDCGGYKALDSGGVVLTRDQKRKHVIGYVPEDALVYILPDDVAAERGGGEPNDDEEESETESSSADEDTEGAVVTESEAETDTESEAETDTASEETAADDETDANEVSEADTKESVEPTEDVDETVVSAAVGEDLEGVTRAIPDDGAVEHTHEAIVERIDDLESRVDGLDGRVDAMTDQLADVVAHAEMNAEEERSPDDVRNIRGIGTAYAARLRASGIDTISALRDADEAEIAAATDASEHRVREWKRRAEAAFESDVGDDERDERDGDDTAVSDDSEGETTD